MGWGIGEMIIVVFKILSVVAFGVTQAKRPFLKDGIGTVPEANRKTKPALLIRNTQQAVFTPAIHPRTGVIVGKGSPGIAIGRIIFTYGAPLAVG